MDIISAFKTTTEQIVKWANDKISGKVDKVSGKGLSTNDYTMADKNKVANIPNDLVILDGKLFLAQDGVTIDDSAVTLPSGGGGGGGTSASITLTNLLDSNVLTVAVDGEAKLKFNFTSSEHDGDGIAYIYIGGVLKGTKTIVTGDNTLDISEYIGEGTNEVKLTCMDIYSNNKSLSYTVNAISLKITSTFDDSQIYSGDISVRYIPYGAVEKTIHFVVDGVDTTVVVSETGKQQTKVIPAMYHGSHLLKIYATANINGVEIRSNELLFDVLCVKEGATTPMVASAYGIKSITQGELINIPFMVYDPSNMETEITLTISQNDEVYSTSTRTVDRTRQFWNTRNYPVGEVTFTITYGNINKSHTITVVENKINVSVKETDLEFQLRAAGRSNTDNDREVWSDGDITTTFEYINWESTGWVNDENGDTALRLSGDAKATINFMPFKTDARQTGRTIEMEFAVRDVNNRNAVAISCLSGGIGFTVTADTAKLMSEQSEIMCNYTDEEKIRVAFVIEPRSEYRLVSVYLNGVLSGAKQYLENDNWQQTDPVNITVGSPYCSIDLYCIRSYNTALITTEVRDNYIADIANVQEKTSLYTDNNIYDDFGGLSFSALKDKIPVLVITGSLPTYKGDKRNVTVTYTDPLNPSLDFEDTAKIDVQGTSSAGYVRKNWKIKTTDPHILDLNQVETKVLCWKVDYAEATGTHNTGNANYVHMFYGDVQTPPQEDDDRVRTTIYGRPCVIFHRADSGSNPVFYGKSNANIDKGGEEVFGFTHPEYADIAQSVEFCNNDILACKFHAPIPDSWGSAFEFRYPDGYEDISDFKIMHDWVVSTWQEGASGDELGETYIGVDGTQYTHDTAEYRLAKFKKEFNEHFDFDFCLIYYLYTFVILMVDQRAKNMFLTTWDRVHWQPWLYDNDTCLGINNVGQLVFDYYHEDHDYIGDKYVYNGAESTLWVNFREAFADEIRELYAEWRKSDSNEASSYADIQSLLSYDKIIEYFITRQSDKWSISVYNEDAEFKYISMLRSDNDATNLPQIRGTGEEHLKYFVKNRLMYCDSKWNAGYYPEDRITLRLYSPEGDLAIAPNHDITVTSYSNIYAGVKYNANGILQQKRIDKNTPTTFHASSDSEFGDTDTYIYGASEMSSIGDLASLYCGYVDVSNATKLTELIIGSDVEGYSNTNLKTITVGTNRLLKKINICNCPNVTDPLGLANCPNIQEIYATGSSITGVELPSSGYLKKVYLPGTLTNLTVTNQQYIQEFELEGYDALTTLRIEDTVNVPVEDIMLNAPNLNRIRLIDVTWNADSEAALVQTIEKFKSCLGLDANGNNTDKAIVTGRVYVSEKVSDQVVGDIYNYFPDLIVDDGSEEIYIINYKDWDGTILYTDRLAEGADAVDPIQAGLIDEPLRPSDEYYSYEFIGWNIIPTNVSRHYIVTAQYNTKVAVNFAVDGEIIHSEYVIYGYNAEDPVANGTIEPPVKEGTDDLHYVFDRWDGSLLNVTMPRTVNAIFANVYPVRFYATESATTPYYVQWVKEGNDAHDPVLAGECGVPDDILESNDKKYVFSVWSNIPTNITSITNVYATYDTYWVVRFYNESVVVDSQWIKDGESAVDPITRYDNPIEIPTKTSTAQYDYTFSKWDNAYTNITAPTKIYAVYNNITRKYTVTFYNIDNGAEILLYTQENVPYGSAAIDPVANGKIPTPVKLGVEDATKYDYTGWNPSHKDIQGDTKCYAMFRYNDYIQDDWATIAANANNGTATTLYSIGARKELSITLSDGNTYTVDVEIIAYNHDDLSDGSGKATLTFFCKNLPGFKHAMYNNTSSSTNANTDGWAGSDMRVFTNGELFISLPEDLRTVIQPVIKISDGGANNSELVQTNDYCWLLSYDEAGFAPSQYLNTIAGQGNNYASTFGYGSEGNSTRLKYLSDGYTAERWWLRSSAYTSSNVSFTRVQNSGGAQQDTIYVPRYVAFGFCIGKFNGNAESPSATVNNVSVDGMTGNKITNANIFVTIHNDTFKSTLSGDWITNLPAGLMQSVSRTSDNMAMITISGTPTEVSTDVMTIKIPASNLASNADLMVTTNNNTKFNIVMSEAEKPSATIGDVTVNGVVGSSMTNESVVVTLANDTFKSTIYGTWITNLPEGLTQIVTRNSDNKATIMISGTPTKVCADTIKISIPADNLLSGADLIVTENGNAKFNITEAEIVEPASATVTNVIVNGEIGSVITDTNVVITLANDTFKSNVYGNWITNLPTGLTQSVSRNSDNKATITISGTPMQASTAVMHISIPAASLSSNTDIIVTENSNAKFNITEPEIVEPEVVEPGYMSYGNRAAQIASTYQLTRVLGNDTFAYSTDSLFSSDELGDGRRVRDSSGNGVMDCSTYVGLCLRGIPYENSPFAKYEDPGAIWEPADELPSMYGTEGWEFDELDNQSYNEEYSNIGIPGRYSVRFAAAYGYYFYNHGQVLFDSEKDGAPTAKLWKNLNLQPGDLIFWSKSSASDTVKERFKDISHVAIVSENISSFLEVTSVSNVVVYSAFENKYEEISLICRPFYRERILPVNENILHYPWFYGALTPSPTSNIICNIIDANTINLSGTSTAEINRRIKGKISTDPNTRVPFTLPAGKYQLSGMDNTGVSNSSVSLQIKNIDGTDFETPIVCYKGNNPTFTISKTTDVAILLHIDAGCTLNCNITPTLVRVD